jgi:ATP-binding cassette subfamily F protein 3
MLEWKSKKAEGTGSMIILSATNLTKAYGVDIILSGITFNINKGDRVGLIGINGAGKTTLLTVLAGELPADSGDFFVAGNTKIGYLKQSGTLSSDNTVYEEMLTIFEEVVQMEVDLALLSTKIATLSAEGQDVEKLLHAYDDLMEAFKQNNGYGYKSEIIGILNSLAFPADYLDKQISILSGGEKTRLALAAILLKKPDLLLLDEPTNHLDIDTLKWLEQYLKNYAGTIVLISHDRYFLDQTVNRIFEIENRVLFAYEGNYTAYAWKKKERQMVELRMYDKQQTEIQRQEEIIRRFKQHGTEKLAKRAQSREKRLSHVEVLDKPVVGQSKIKFNFKQGPQSGRDSFSAHDLSKSFGEGSNKRLLFEHVAFDIKRNERICIVGPNGIGKTTLLKILISELSPDSGTIQPGHNVVIGYYDQEQELLNPENTVINELHSTYRLYTETEIRSLLGRFLFRGDEVFKPVSALSGGEKARLSLLKLMISGSNFLIMDEPTNHLDIASKELFEDALLDFPGTLLLVSHDRYFLNKVPTRIIELSTTGTTNYLGGYDYYSEKKLEVQSSKAYLSSLSKSISGGQSLDQSVSEIILSQKEARVAEWKSEKESQSMQKKKEKDLLKMESEIHRFEERIKEIQDQMCQESTFSDHLILGDLNDELLKTKDALEKLYERWMASH